MKNPARSRVTVSRRAATPVLAMLALLVGHAHDAASRGRAPHLVVATLPGELKAAQTEALWRPFTRETRTVVDVVTWDGTLSQLRQRLRARKHDWSLALIEDTTLSVGCGQGLFLHTGNSPRDKTTGVSDGCGVHALSVDLALTWDASKLQTAPTWADFWDVARHPGKRGLRCDPRGTLEAALLSDGVPPGDIYATLATPEGVERAFKRLSQLRPYIVWWSTPEEAARILTSGAALMGTAPTAEILAANARSKSGPFGILWSPRLRVDYDWVIPAGSGTNTNQGKTLEDWATAPEQFQAMAIRYPSAPLPADPVATSGSSRKSGDQSSGTKDVATNVAPESAPVNDTPPPLPISSAFWRDHLPAIETRFDQWLAER
ncbi:extracellular solute-binding protein [Acetobacter nitrogenifigens]|uniref:extracellular solute-binding protein n=1 Tax=Acetobacter nitrogenifigens TaxID=285268 RepID=UPI001FED6FA5|nr:extracellular solute-binding protein [Acetobacter nitrogenifigens]